MPDRFVASALAALLVACTAPAPVPNAPVDPDTAPRVAVDRFSGDLAHFFSRERDPTLPAANEPIDLDRAPFFSRGFGPLGEAVACYNLDAVSASPIPIYVLFREGESEPVSGQLNIVHFIPGEPSYTDFWRVTRVIVPKDYIANTATSLAELTSRGYTFERTTMLVNCPVVPNGSTARLRYTAAETPELIRGWYKNQVVTYFTFAENAFIADADDLAPRATVYAAFTTNLDANDPTSGPPSGFATDATGATHNVHATLPTDAGYSPLWNVTAYDNRDFDGVRDLATAEQATRLPGMTRAMNCPIVSVQ